MVEFSQVDFVGFSWWSSMDPHQFLVKVQALAAKDNDVPLGVLKGS